MTKVLILTKSHCNDCTTLKRMLATLADEFTFELQEVNLDSAAGIDLAQQHGIAWAPGVIVDNTHVSYGRPSQRRLRRDLRTTSATTTSGKDNS